MKELPLAVQALLLLASLQRCGLLCTLPWLDVPSLRLHVGNSLNKPQESAIDSSPINVCLAVGMWIGIFLLSFQGARSDEPCRASHTSRLGTNSQEV
jgi:hypothetical protein